VARKRCVYPLFSPPMAMLQVGICPDGLQVLNVTWWVLPTFLCLRITVAWVYGQRGLGSSSCSATTDGSVCPWACYLSSLGIHFLSVQWYE
jgi:hypothetical protein